MPKVAHIQDSFASGEFSPAVQGRKSFDGYKSALKKVENYLVGDKGQLIRRMGFRAVAETKSSGVARLIPFEFNVEQTYILEFGDLYMRVYKNNAQLGAPYEIVTPYAADDLEELWYEQINDVVYITHPDYNVRKLSRTGDTSWTLEEIDFYDGPYLPRNTEDTTVSVSGSGPYTLTFSAVTGINQDAGFATADIGRLVRIEDDNSTDYKTYEITGITSTTVVTAEFKYESDTGHSFSGATDLWRLGAFCPRFGYPDIVVYHDARLFLLGNGRVHGSVIDDLEAFSPTDFSDYTQVLDESAISRPLADQNPITWALSGPTLQIGTKADEYQLKPASISDPLTPTNNTAERQNTRIGGYKSRPVNAGATIFIQRSRRKVFDFFYSIADESFKARNISILSDAILREGGGAEEVVYAKEPNSVVYGRLTDGSMFGITYIRDQNMINMVRLPLEQGLQVESLATITSPDESYTQVWAVIKYVADSATKRYVCRLEKDFEPSSPTDKNEFHFMDLMTTVTDQTTTTVTGVGYLEGMTVDVVVDGVAQTQKVVEDGEFTLDWVNSDGSTVHYGIPYTPSAELLMPEGGNPFGTAHGKIKKVEDVGLSVLNTIGVSIGGDNDNMEQQEFRLLSPPTDEDDSPLLYTGETPRYKIKQGYTRDPAVIIRQEQPYPSTIRNVYLDLQIQEK